MTHSSILGLPYGSAGKESTCNAGNLGSVPGLGKIPWRRERLPTPVFWPGEFHGLCSPWGGKELDTTERLSHVYLRICFFHPAPTIHKTDLSSTFSYTKSPCLGVCCPAIRFSLLPGSPTYIMGLLFSKSTAFLSPFVQEAVIGYLS